ncbi:undecaprenyl/decaprenyl-phosphate alpha-N-acetylglucosaminyl 1-phosphate transferase [Mycetocola tolaasinivorans]|uniref:Undecaprenyl/decaprenyl-phosphate alpha-N-acetylglucosaminyl 1-phosphate transferase n=1 Tax=Mycetocola tolaasinivorans TaxID=76635 RepID=A0A3L6ZZW0_9MICO|nr:MraY family glycosyltransferase [Mycetocola tolaasinivorans]RLP73354.1 undecaprenyl/decaprenyl-phosphate alpha-N-acetylglucosaminyl 1-phosphate transferase [Mycetocola tolaasinivorans]
MIQYVLVTFLTALTTWALSWAVYKIALKYKLYPEIRDRDVHTRPTPRLGGVAMFLGVIAAAIYASINPFLSQTFSDAPGQLIAVLGAAALIVVVGVLDDLIDLDWMIKLAAQFVAAGVIAFSGVQLYSLPIGGITVGSSQMSFVLTTFTLVLIMNAVNFIDGLDGLVAGVGLIANGAFFIYGYLLVRSMGQTSFFNLPLLLSAILVGICAGFLFLNWHPARMFMGDAGALLIGLLMATSAVAITGQIDPSALGVGQGTASVGRTQLIGAFIPIILPVAILVVPLLDFVLAVFRRTVAGTSPFTADRKHLHHRLLDMGHSHLQAVLVFYAWTAVISASCLIAFVVTPSWIAVVFLVVGVIICLLWTFAPRLNRWRARSIAVREARAAGETVVPEPFRAPRRPKAPAETPSDAPTPDLPAAKDTPA